MRLTGSRGLSRHQRKCTCQLVLRIEILFCGICHSDLHSVRNEWGSFIPTVYPIVPGHEIVGRVTQVGKNVTKFRVGDYAGVGCLVNSCGDCESCKKGEERYCDRRVLTYASIDHFHNNDLTQGGYSNNIVVSEKFAIKIPRKVQIEKVAPLLCTETKADTNSIGMEFIAIPGGSFMLRAEWLKAHPGQ